MLRLQAERERLGLSRSEIARRAGMHPSTVSQIEALYIGKPYPSQLEKLRAAIGYAGDAAELLDDVEAGSH